MRLGEHLRRRPPPLPWRRPRHELLLIALVAVATLTPLYPINAQDVARVCLTRSLVHGHLYNDACLGTGFAVDRSAYKGHYYSDKAPGMSALEIPGVELAQVPNVTEWPLYFRKLWVARVLAGGLAFIVGLFLVGRLSEGLAPGYGGPGDRRVRPRDARRAARRRELRARDRGHARPGGVRARVVAPDAPRGAGRRRGVCSSRTTRRSSLDDRRRLRPAAGRVRLLQVRLRRPAGRGAAVDVQLARLRRPLAHVVHVQGGGGGRGADDRLLRHPPAVRACHPPRLRERERSARDLAGRARGRLRAGTARPPVSRRGARVRGGRIRVPVPELRLHLPARRASPRGRGTSCPGCRSSRSGSAPAFARRFWLTAGSRLSRSWP